MPPGFQHQPLLCCTEHRGTQSAPSKPRTRLHEGQRPPPTGRYGPRQPRRHCAPPRRGLPSSICHCDLGAIGLHSAFQGLQIGGCGQLAFDGCTVAPPTLSPPPSLSGSELNAPAARGKAPRRNTGKETRHVEGRTSPTHIMPRTTALIASLSTEGCIVAAQLGLARLAATASKAAGLGFSFGAWGGHAFCQGIEGARAHGLLFVSGPVGYPLQGGCLATYARMGVCVCRKHGVAHVCSCHRTLSNTNRASGRAANVTRNGSSAPQTHHRPYAVSAPPSGLRSHWAGD